jgi:hypothetical protein
VDDERGGEASSLAEAREHRTALRLGQGHRVGPVPDVHTVVRGDTLWDITGRYFGNPWDWPRIWSYNPEITNPHWIYPLDHIRLRAGATEAPSQLPGAGDGSGGIQIAGGRGNAAPSGTIWMDNEGFLDPDEFEAAGVIVGSPEEHMLLSTYDDVYLQFGEGVEPSVGHDYSVFVELEPNPGREYNADRSAAEKGTLVRIVGTVRLRSYDSDRRVGRGVITASFDPIERGFRIADIPRSFQMVQPRVNESDVQAEVVATLRPRVILGADQVIFVNAGEEQGVRQGNRFFIVREGDTWQQGLGDLSIDPGSTVEQPDQPEEYPPEVIAEARVIDVRTRTSALMVTRAVNEVVVGDRVEMRRGF